MELTRAVLAIFWADCCFKANCGSDFNKFDTAINKAVKARWFPDVASLRVLGIADRKITNRPYGRYPKIIDKFHLLQDLRWFSSAVAAEPNKDEGLKIPTTKYCLGNGTAILSLSGVSGSVFTTIHSLRPLSREQIDYSSEMGIALPDPSAINCNTLNAIFFDPDLFGSEYGRGEEFVYFLSELDQAITGKKFESYTSDHSMLALMEKAATFFKGAKDINPYSIFEFTLSNGINLIFTIQKEKYSDEKPTMQIDIKPKSIPVYKRLDEVLNGGL